MPYFTELMVDGLFKYMKQFESEELKHNVHTTFEGIVICLSHGLKGSVEEKAQFLGCLCSGEVDVKPNLGQIQQVYRLKVQYARPNILRSFTLITKLM